MLGTAGVMREYVGAAFHVDFCLRACMLSSFLIMKHDDEFESRSVEKRTYLTLNYGKCSVITPPRMRRDSV
jgi:hypothetical protein